MLFRTVLVSALAVVPAGAQPVDSFRELAELVELGEDVRVTHRGQVLEGRALDISPTTLTVLAAGVPLELDEAAVTRIRQRSPRCRTLVSSSSRRRFSEACPEAVASMKSSMWRSCFRAYSRMARRWLLASCCGVETRR